MLHRTMGKSAAQRAQAAAHAEFMKGNTYRADGPVQDPEDWSEPRKKQAAAFEARGDDYQAYVEENNRAHRAGESRNGIAKKFGGKTQREHLADVGATRSKRAGLHTETDVVEMLLLEGTGYWPDPETANYDAWYAFNEEHILFPDEQYQSKILPGQMAQLLEPYRWCRRTKTWIAQPGVHVSGCLSPAQAALEGRIVFMRADVYAPNAELLGPCFKVMVKGIYVALAKHQAYAKYRRSKKHPRNKQPGPTASHNGVSYDCSTSPIIILAQSKTVNTAEHSMLPNHTPGIPTLNTEYQWLAWYCDSCCPKVRFEWQEVNGVMQHILICYITIVPAIKFGLALAKPQSSTSILRTPGSHSTSMKGIVRGSNMSSTHYDNNPDVECGPQEDSGEDSGADSGADSGEDMGGKPGTSAQHAALGVTVPSPQRGRRVGAGSRLAAVLRAVKYKQ